MPVIIEVTKGDVGCSTALSIETSYAALIKNGDGPPLELVSHCIVIPPDIPPDRPFDLFEDAVEEKVCQRRCTLYSHFDEIGRHLIIRF